METLRFLLVTTFYPPYHLGGDATHVQYLARALGKRGHEVHVEFSPAAFRLKTKRKPAPSNRSPDESVRLHPIRSRYGRLQPLSAFLTGQSKGVNRSHEKLVAQTKPDVVHLHNISLLGLGVLPKKAGQKTLYTAHDYWVRCPRSDLFKFGRYPCDAPTCFRCGLATGRPPQLWRYGRGWKGMHGIDCAIAPSRFMKSAVERLFRCPVVHLPNFAPDHNPAGTSQTPGDYYLYAGTLEPHRGIVELAAAANGNASRLPLVVAGRGSLEGPLKKLENSDGTNVHLTGWLEAPKLEPLYRKAKAFIMPSLSYDNAPLAAIEALSWGAPLLVSHRGGLLELIYDGQTGRSFEPEPSDILRTVERFEAEGLHFKLRQAAREAYESHHHPDSYMTRYLSLVKDLDSIGAAEGTPVGPLVPRGPDGDRPQ